MTPEDAKLRIVQNCVGDMEALKIIERAAFRAGASAFRTKLIRDAIGHGLFDEDTGLLERLIRDLPLPEMPHD